MSNISNSTVAPAAAKTRRKALTPAEKIAKLEEQQAQLAARIQNEKSKISKEKRKLDTRRKIVAGALALEHMEHNPEFATEMVKLINRHTKEADKILFDDLLETS